MGIIIAALLLSTVVFGVMIWWDLHIHEMNMKRQAEARRCNLRRVK